MENRTQWRGERDTARRRLWTLLGVSVLLHVPLTPLAALLGLLAFLGAEQADVPDAPPLVAIPVDLLNDSELPGATEPPAAPAAAPESELGSAEPEVVRKPAPKPKAPEEIADAGADGGETDAAATSDAGADDAGTGAGIGSVALAGAAQRIADPNANVKLKVYTERLRGHPLGRDIGSVLGRVAQWRDFLGPGGIDPVRDIDRLYIAAPQLRNTSEMVVMLRYNNEARQIRAAIDALPGSEWLPGEPPAARARVDRAERVLAMATTHHVWIVPPALGEQARKLRVTIPAAQGDEVVTGEVRTPWRAVIGLPFQIPKSIEWLRFRVVPTPDGGAVVSFEAQDVGDAEALDHARLLESELRRTLQPNFVVFGMKFVERINISSEGSKITGEISATSRQLRSILGILESRMMGGRQPPAIGSDAGAPTPGPTNTAWTPERRAPRGALRPDPVPEPEPPSAPEPPAPEPPSAPEPESP